MLRRMLLTSVAGLLLGSVIPVTSFAQERVVNVFNWSDYIDDSILTDFTKETGIKVVYDTFDSNEILETKLLAGASGYDVVVPSAYFLARQIQAGVFQPLDKAKLPNLVNMWDFVSARTAVFDPDNSYSVNYMWGTTGIGYNVKKVKETLGIDKIDSWSVLFDPANMEKLNACGVYMLDSPTDVLPSLFVWLGIKPDSLDPADFAKAQEAMAKVRPFVRKFNSSEYINALAGGDICVAMGYSGDVFQARDRAEKAGNGVEIAYSVPKEGAQLTFDQMAVPADAPHPAEALEFINYMMKPEIIAKATNYVYFANGNKASQAFLNKDVIDDPAIYPDEATLAKLFTIPTYDPKVQRLITRTWTTIVTGQ